eukprot:TRINITY_DN332_c0_g1_i12.p3 TRINITY_DN332_c0_g1~~TRINITY_DN332_c0_g1_i12.p3  ORF type:complete len:119 (-),score=18.63 TRINITY_DN332_c0_g1_i12:207-563(-)
MEQKYKCTTKCGPRFKCLGASSHHCEATPFVCRECVLLLLRAGQRARAAHERREAPRLVLGRGERDAHGRAAHAAVVRADHQLARRVRAPLLALAHVPVRAPRALPGLDVVVLPVCHG